MESYTVGSTDTSALLRESIYDDLPSIDSAYIAKFSKMLVSRSEGVRKLSLVALTLYVSKNLLGFLESLGLPSKDGKIVVSTFETINPAYHIAFVRRIALHPDALVALRRIPEDFDKESPSNQSSRGVFEFIDLSQTPKPRGVLTKRQLLSSLSARTYSEFPDPSNSLVWVTLSLDSVVGIGLEKPNHSAKAQNSPKFSGVFTPSTKFSKNTTPETYNLAQSAKEPENFLSRWAELVTEDVREGERSSLRAAHNTPVTMNPGETGSWGKIMQSDSKLPQINTYYPVRHSPLVVGSLIVCHQMQIPTRTKPRT